MPKEASTANSHSTVKDQVVELYEDFEHKVEREVHNPSDSSQSDMLVGKHISGLVITFFILIALALLAVIVGGCDLYPPLEPFEFKLLHNQKRRDSFGVAGCREPPSQQRGRSLRSTASFVVDPESVGDLLRNWTTDNLDESAGLYLPSTQ
jgi:hypothetical protein